MDAAQLLQAAFAAHNAGRLDEARGLYERLLQINPTHRDALHLLGVIALQTGQPAQAERLISQAINVAPGQAAFHANLGVAQSRLGNHGGAMGNYRTAVMLKPNYPEAWLNLGISLAATSQHAEAIAAFTQAIAQTPQPAEALFRRAQSFEAGQNHQAALDDLDRCLTMETAVPEVHLNRGANLHALKRFEQALASHETAIRLKPDYALAHHHRAVALTSLGRYQDALEAHDRAMQLAPNGLAAASDAPIELNRGVVAHRLNRLDEALVCLDHALALQPGLAEAEWCKALTLLLQGRLQEAWPFFEARWRVGVNVAQTPIAPRWDGESNPAGKRILLRSEQGLGDSIMFARFASLLAERGGVPILEVEPPLTGLLARVKGVSSVVAKGSPPPQVDWEIGLMSLAGVFDTTIETIPAPHAYLSALPEQIDLWRERLAGLPRPWIGLAWSGNPRHHADAERSQPLAALLDSLPVGPTYVVLQRDVRPEDETALGRIRHFGADLISFEETAGLCANLDAVLTVDTSLAHLAGALGTPTWMMTPFNPDWRWMLERSDSPWYPSLTLLRQGRRGDWSDVHAEARRKILDLSAASVG